MHYDIAVDRAERDDVLELLADELNTAALAHEGEWRDVISETFGAVLCAVDAIVDTLTGDVPVAVSVAGVVGHTCDLGISIDRHAHGVTTANVATDRARAADMALALDDMADTFVDLLTQARDDPAWSDNRRGYVDVQVGKRDLTRMAEIVGTPDRPVPRGRETD